MNIHVYGAGPSLTDTLKAPAAGDIRIAVNTCARKVDATHGITHACAIESLDVAEQLPDVSVVTDLTVHPNVIKSRQCDVYLPPMTAEFGLLYYQTGIPILPHGGAALTAAVAWAALKRPQEIVLHGCDLSYTRNRTHADGTRWEGQKVELNGTHAKIDQRADREALHRMHGIPIIPRERQLIPMPAINGGTVYAPSDFLSQIRWLERFARSPISAGIDLVNATVEGVFLAGWHHEWAPAPVSTGAPMEVQGTTYTGAPAEPTNEWLAHARAFSRDRAYLLTHNLATNLRFLGLLDVATQIDDARKTARWLRGEGRLSAPLLADLSLIEALSVSDEIRVLEAVKRPKDRVMGRAKMRLNAADALESIASS